MKVLIALLFVAVFIYSFSDKIYQYLVPISYLIKDVFLIIAVILIHLSLLWISVAQYQMSNSWRVGIDENNKTELITKGLFSYSRNPIFFRNDNQCCRNIFYTTQCTYIFLDAYYLYRYSNSDKIRRRVFGKTTRRTIFNL